MPPGRQRSEAERRAMFARMRGGGATRSWTARDEPRDLMAEIDDANSRTTERLKKLGVYGTLPGVGGLGASARGVLSHPAVRSAMASLASGLASSAVGAYRESDPTMDPRKERGLAKVQDLLATISALAGIRAAKTGGRALSPDSFTRLDINLAKASNVMLRLGKKVAGVLPDAVKGPLAAAKGVYEGLAGLTGNELPSLAQIPAAGRLLAQGQVKEAMRNILGPALVTAGVAGIEVGEQKRIAGYKDEIAARWDAGQDYELPADPDPVIGPLSTLAAFAVGTLGNPIEKQLRAYFGGRYTKDLADVAAYEVQYDGIAEQERTGYLTPAQAEKAREALAQWKPWNMGGRSIYSFTPAAASFVKWQASELGKKIVRPIQVGTVAEVLDADTIRLEGGNPKGVRFTGINAPEIDHGPGKPAEYLGPEAAAWQRAQLLGKTVRLVQDPNATSDIYGRDLAFVETLPGPLDKLLTVPGLNRILPAVDQNKKTLAEGLAAPKKAHERLPGGKHERLAEYDRTVADAIARGVGVHSPEGQELYPWKYTPTRTNEPTALAKAANVAGMGLLVSGNTGLFKKLGPAGSPAAQAWNAALSALGTAQHIQSGNANTGRVYRLPKNYASEYERRSGR